MKTFKLESSFQPTGDQPQAIDDLVRGLRGQRRYQTLLGVTGSGKTFTLANVIARVNRPTLVISHNKTLASQLYSEFKEFFPRNAVEYFVSYYDYYQPESYIPHTDTYIEKDASINEKLDRLRLSTTSSLVSRRDVLVVASVSAIYNLGSPRDYMDLILYIRRGEMTGIEDMIRRLIELQYERNDYDFGRGTFRVKGDTLDIAPAYKQTAIRIEFFADEIEHIFEINRVTGEKISALAQIGIYPAKHFIMAEEKISGALGTIERELKERLSVLDKDGKTLEAHRLRTRVKYDMEMLKEFGYCHGIENYSRHLSGRPPGSRPYCLIDYFPDDFLTVIDESHVTIPQIRGMYAGDRSRKETLVRYGFRLPSCLDNRPLRYDEFSQLTQDTIFVSATPAEYERSLSRGRIVEQVIRPTGLPDPEIEVRPVRNQIDDLIGEVKTRSGRNERTLITTLTKRMAEELSNYLAQEGLKVTYLHSEIDALERTKILKELRMKTIDAVVGINLLREGLDLPEVSLVAILDANREGFLRSATSLIQIAGRCARNVNGKVVMYADSITKSMRQAIDESRRRRKKQLAYNRRYRITPTSIQKAVREGIEMYLRDEEALNEHLELNSPDIQIHEKIAELETEMFLAAEHMQFEKAARLRDRIKKLQETAAQPAPRREKPRDPRRVRPRRRKK
ncbi:MAG: excinuclease ABC subunit UvrB [Candidatus Omnitrophica bacterium]|nr:excinuclease ABC subunit UvrB [Candidatus Omnitrophota bacterium]